MTDKNMSVTDLVDKALGRSYNLGQTYWQQADHEFASYHRKAEKTQAKFDAIRAETNQAIAALLTERDALRELAQAVDDAMTNYERMGEVCPFEGQPMIYAETLTELGDLARAALTQGEKS